MWNNLKLLLKTKKNKNPNNSKYPETGKIISLQESWDWNTKDSKAATEEEDSEPVTNKWDDILRHTPTLLCLLQGPWWLRNYSPALGIPRHAGAEDTVGISGNGAGRTRNSGGRWSTSVGSPGNPPWSRQASRAISFVHPDSRKRERYFKVTLGPPGKQEHRRLSMCWGRAAERLWRERAKWIETC